MLNKILKMTGIVFLFALAYTFFTDNTPSFIKDAETDLMLAYRDAGYSHSCRTTAVKTTWVVFCSIDDKKTGGLYEIEKREAGEYPSYNIFAINGKAQQHAERLELPINVKYNSDVDINEIVYN